MIIEDLYTNGKLITPEALKYVEENNLSIDKLLNLKINLIKKEDLQENLQVEIKRERKKIISEEYEIDLKINNYYVKHKERKTSDFLNYFNSRFSLIQKMLIKRMSPISICNISKTSNDEIDIIGLVYEIRSTSNGNKIIELEDPTGRINCLILKNSNNSIFEESYNILKDEVIGARGYYKNNYFFINEIIRPDIPITNKLPKLEVPLNAVFLSDLHVGSIDFLDNLFKKFINWIKSEECKDVKYIFIAGDLVDGIGIYLEQEKDLSVKDGKKQYELLAEYLSEIPEHIKIITSPGNHDIVGNHEPQPTLENTALSKLPNIIFGTNPCSIVLENRIKILMYHGYSYDDIINDIQSIRQNGYKKPCLPMIEVLKRRHLAPIYGSSLVLPEDEDNLVIKEIPNIFHSGHLHTVGVDNYRNVLTINSGTFQARTKYQERIGHIPHPGIFVKVNFQTMEYKLINLNN
ncbi:MAG: DNA polymerase II [Candidatus Aenigmarchaeota archaeon ex4484_56]|nr:MAG: DNA polymerase II [Candidatus Aenigmarchaeota archaeon ex4484_56]